MDSDTDSNTGPDINSDRDSDIDSEPGSDTDPGSDARSRAARPGTARPRGCAAGFGAGGAAADSDRCPGLRPRRRLGCGGGAYSETGARMGGTCEGAVTPIMTRTAARTVTRILARMLTRIGASSGSPACRG